MKIVIDIPDNYKNLITNAWSYGVKPSMAVLEDISKAIMNGIPYTKQNALDEFKLCDDIYKRAWIKMDKLMGKRTKPRTKWEVKSDGMILEEIKYIFYKVASKLFPNDYEYVPYASTQECNTCKHNDKEWDEEPCDGCCGNHSGYEPKEIKNNILLNNIKAEIEEHNRKMLIDNPYLDCIQIIDKYIVR